MRILYLIGNGFDLHVGLNTSYYDFLNYYLQQPIPDELDEVGKRYVKRLKEDIKKDIDLWSNFELQYGKHMAKLGSVGSAVHSLQEEMDIINDNIRESLSMYISNQEKRVVFTDNAKKQFIEDLIVPEQHLRDYERQDIKNRRNNMWHTTPNVVDIISFNYTRTIECLLGKPSVQLSGFQISEPIHVHGYHDNRMIMGVNDTSQIENDQLCKLAYATDALVKSACNHTYGDAHTTNCESLIKNAQLICCYGLSYGETDKCWWKKICNELSKRGDLIVILYSYSPNLPNYANMGHKLQNKMRQEIDAFLTKGGIKEPEKEEIAKRVYVSLNDPIFKFRIDDRTPMDKLMGKSAPGTLERFAEDATVIISARQ